MKLNIKISDSSFYVVYLYRTTNIVILYFSSLLTKSCRLTFASVLGLTQTKQRYQETKEKR